MREEVAIFGSTGALCGVVTHPGGERETEWGAALLNAGLVHRVGPNRLHVQLARSLAMLGFTALRFDFSGIGDSPARADNVRFERTAVEETQAAMDWLSLNHRCRRFILVGICSGAEIAFKTACQDPRVAGAALINAPRYEEEPSPELLAQLARRQETHYYWRVAFYNSTSWLRLLSGRSNYAALLRGVGHKLRGVLLHPTGAAPDRNADVEAFEALLRRDVHLLLLFSEGDPGLSYLPMVLGRRADGWRARGRLRLEVVERSDHTLTPFASRERGLGLIIEWARTACLRVSAAQVESPASSARFG